MELGTSDRPPGDLDKDFQPMADVPLVGAAWVGPRNRQWSSVRHIHRDPLVQLEYSFAHGAGVLCCQGGMQCESLDNRFLYPWRLEVNTNLQRPCEVRMTLPSDWL
jgi:hypothetical protein